MAEEKGRETGPGKEVYGDVMDEFDSGERENIQQEAQEQQTQVQPIVDPVQPIQPVQEGVQQEQNVSQAIPVSPNVETQITNETQLQVQQTPSPQIDGYEQRYKDLQSYSDKRVNEQNQVIQGLQNQLHEQINTTNKRFNNEQVLQENQARDKELLNQFQNIDMLNVSDPNSVDAQKLLGVIRSAGNNGNGITAEEVQNIVNNAVAEDRKTRGVENAWSNIQSKYPDANWDDFKKFQEDQNNFTLEDDFNIYRQKRGLPVANQQVNTQQNPNVPDNTIGNINRVATNLNRNLPGAMIPGYTEETTEQLDEVGQELRNKFGDM